MKEINQFKQLIIDGEYYNAHEALEEVWFPIRKTKTNYCLVLKGFINGAVSLELFKRGKVEQSKNVHKTYLKYTNESMLKSLDNYDAFKDLKEFTCNEFQKTYKLAHHNLIQSPKVEV